MSLTLPGETAYVEGVDVGIVNVRPPAGVDCALRIWFMPPLFARITLYVVLGVKPEPSNPTAAALESWNDTSAAERPVTSKLARGPVHEACSVWESAAVPVSKTIMPPTLAERFTDVPDHATTTLAAAGDVTNRTGVRSVFLIDRKSTRLNSSHRTISYA